MNNDLRGQAQVAQPVRSNAAVFMQHVYAWMAAALGVTGLTAWFTSQSPAVLNLFFGNFIMIILMVVAIFGLVMFLNSSMHRLSPGVATLLFMIYAALMGVFLGPTLLVYSGATVTKAFLVCSGMFVGMSAYGMLTKRDLTGMGSFLMMGLLGLIIAMVVNLFMRSSGLDWGISVIGVLLFTGLTAYDAQRIKAMGESAPLDDSAAIRRGAILGAISLYLNFVNLFLMLLRLFSGRD